MEKQISSNNWDEIDSWTKTVNSYRSSFTNTKSGLSSGRYRVTTIAKVYVGRKGVIIPPSLLTVKVYLF